MEINRLAQDELQYEMDVRGLPRGNVDCMRRALRASRLLERRGSMDTQGDYPFSFQADCDAIEGKIAEIQVLLQNPPTNPKSGEYLKILTKIEWALARLGRAIAEEPEEVNDKGKLRNRLIVLLGILTDSEGDENNAEEEEKATKSGMVRNSVPQVSAEPIPTVRELTLQTSERCAERIEKWDVKFTGERCGASVNAFLERVEELRQARGVTEAHLFRSAVDLFIGKALLWFRAIRVTIGTWQELVRELKEEFLPPNYDDLLLDEIRRRTQGKEESIGVYVATMANMFRRLSEPLSEKRQLAILQRNLAPFYQTQLGLADPKSVNDLVVLGRRLETVRANVETFAPPPSIRSRHLLEPDLAYVAVEEEPMVAVVGRNAQPTKVIRCFNCNGEGHYANNCSAPRRCLGCGRVGVSRRDCRSCSGNEQRTLGSAGRGRR